MTPGRLQKAEYRTINILDSSLVLFKTLISGNDSLAPAFEPRALLCISLLFAPLYSTFTSKQVKVLARQISLRFLMKILHAIITTCNSSVSSFVCGINKYARVRIINSSCRFWRNVLNEPEKADTEAVPV